MDDVVELLRRDAGHHVRNERVEDARGEMAGAAHAFEPFRSVQLDDSILGLGTVVRSDGDVLSHAA
jgi:hypothetical protein